MIPPARYTRIAIVLHWLVAFAIFASFGLGLYMQELPLSPAKLRLYAWHKWAGVTIFLLVLARIAWRLAHTPPAPPAGTPIWQQRMATRVHFLLYVLMVAVPVSGWLMSSAKGVQTVYFGVLALPDLLDENEALGDWLAWVHKTLNYSMAGLILIHTAAALKHHFLDRDEVLARMLPFLDKPKSRGEMQ